MTEGPAVPAPDGLVCPQCGTQLAALSERCPACDGRLRPLLQVGDVADAHFNDAVRAAREADWWRAAENLAVAVALRPGDAGAWLLLAKARAHGGRPDAARAACERAHRLAPDREDVRRLREWLDRPPDRVPPDTGA